MRVVVHWDTGEELKRPLAVSAAAHLLLVALLLFSPPPQRGDAWGGLGGGAIQISLVGSAPGMPLPRPPVVANSRVATEVPGLHRAEPEPEPTPKAAAPEPAADEIPSFRESRRRRTETIPPAPRRRPGEAEPQRPQGAIPYGEGGPPAMRYTPFSAQGGSGGSTFGSGGAFSGKYSWYVESVQRRISSNWLISSIDPYVDWAPRVTVTFDILRDGSVASLQIIESSGITSVDRSAIRAVRESSPLPPLPSDYTGSRVSVEFFFDFRRR